MKWSGLVAEVTLPSQKGERTVVIFVHGLFSSAGAWRHFDQLIRSDPELSHLTILNFEYSSPKLNWSPLRGIPDFNVLADNLQTYLEVEAANQTDVVLVSHSQGGLIIQRFLSRMISKGRGDELARIRRIVMFACPNSGSEVFLAARRGAIFWRHAQERDLRPINASVTDAQQIVLSRIVHASSIDANECHIPIVAFAGESDNIVTPASARSVFPDTGVLPGDHFSIIRPDSLNHRAYTALKKNLLMLPWGRRGASAPETTTADPSTSGAVIPLRHENSFKHIATELAEYDSSDRPSVPISGPGADEMSRVIARWNPRERTLDFIMSPEIALALVKKLGDGESTNG
jgi:pimeloyl-ACP methyl ester carboxylesterase